MDGITELTQDMAGTYSVRTSSGTAYLRLTNSATSPPAADTAPVEDFAAIETATLRRDGEAIPLIELDLEVGRRGALVLDVRRDGIATYRDTTPVLSIHRLSNAPQP
jgi:hypothetical protein